MGTESKDAAVHGFVVMLDSSSHCYILFAVGQLGYSFSLVRFL